MELPDVKEKFRLTQVCTEPDFILSTDAESKDDQRRSKINPLYLTVRAKYKNGEVMCNVKISDVYLAVSYTHLSVLHNLCKDYGD